MPVPSESNPFPGRPIIFSTRDVLGNKVDFHTGTWWHILDGHGRADYVETEGGVLRIDGATREIVGLTIPFFLEKWNAGFDMNFPEIGAVGFNQATEDFLRGAMAQADQV